MIAAPGSPQRGLRNGFTLPEMVVACMMSVILVSILASMIGTFERGAAEVIARCELAQEADFAMARLADDLRGYNSARPQTRALYFDPDGLQIIFGDRTISYAVQDGALVRSVEPQVEPASIVAHRFLQLHVQRVDPDEPLYEFSLTLGLPFVENRATQQGLERSFHLIAVLP
jgi:hypothetical protein